MKKAFVLTLILAACLAGAATAEVPSLLNYQGVLTDGSGVAVPDNTYSITFKIYEVPSGGSAIWTETDNVIVAKGTFSVTLGMVSGLNSLVFNTTYYLGMSIGGGSELPRQILTSSPYSLNAKMVRGGENIFPADGKVGIGTLTPAVPLTVTSPSGQVGIEFDGNDDFLSSICVNGVKATAKAGYGYETQSALRAYTFVDPLNNWNLQLGGINYALRASQAGNVCIGASAPSTEKLKVDGGIQLGNALGTNAGTIRWSGSDFEGYNGSTWQSLTATGGGSPPPGTIGQTLRHDGANWVATSSLYNDGAKIGIGTTSPAAPLHILGPGIPEELRIETSNAFGGGLLTLKSTAGGNDYLQIEKNAPSASGTIAGISLAGLSLIMAGTQAGPMMLDVATANPMYFVTGNAERMRLTGDGKLGINVTAPTATLHVGGDVNVGTTSTDGELNIFHSGITNPVATVYGNSNGGLFTAYDEAGNITSSIEPDQDGTGGFLAVERGIGTPGFTVDGNYLGTGDPRVIIAGTNRWAQFNMNASGDGSVSLPLDAISSFEILDEPGIANYATTVGAGLTASFAPYASQTINAPAAGYVLVMGTADVSPNHTSGVATNITISVSASPTSVPATQNIWLYLPAAMPTSTYHYPVTVSGMFQVSAGSNTFYLDAEVTNGVGSIFERNLSIIYIPTAYGSFFAPLTTVSGAGAKDAPTGGALTASDIAATTRASEAANAERIQKELDTMKAQMAALKEQMKTMQDRK